MPSCAAAAGLREALAATVDMWTRVHSGSPSTQLVEVDVGTRRDPQGRRRRDLDVDLLEVHGVPHVGPELHAGGEVADALGPFPQHALDDGDDLLLRDAVPRGELGHLARGDAGADQRLVGVVADAHHLVGGEVVVDVAGVGEQELAAQVGEGRHRVAEVELEALHDVPVPAYAVLCARQHVRRVVGHQVAHAAEVVAPLLLARGGEAVQPHLRPLAVAHAELEHVDLVGQLRPLLQAVQRGHEGVDPVRPELRVGPVGHPAGRAAA